MPDDLGYSIFLDPSDTVRAWQARGQIQTTMDWSEMMHEDHASAFTIAKIARLDLLRYMRNSLDAIITKGGTFEAWRASILPELKRQGWWGAVTNQELTGTAETVIVNERRLRTIYDTNIRMSLASGRWARIQRQKDVLPFLRYLPSRAEHQRPLHKAWYGVLLPVDHPWWRTHFPPNGWGCLCDFEQVSQARMDRKGWTVTPDDQIPDSPPRDWVSALGEVISVPAGVDPGFAYNPGIAMLRIAADKAVSSIELALDAGLEEAARQTVRELVDDVAFDQFLAAPEGHFPIAILTEAQRDAIGAGSQMLLLPNGVMNKQRGLMPWVSAGHPELTPDDYRLLPDVISNALVVARQGDTRLVYFSDARGRLWKCVVRQDADYAFPAIVSFHRSSMRKIASEIRDLPILLDNRA